MVDFLGAKTKKNRQQSEEMKARERRNRGDLQVKMLFTFYEREYSTKIERYTLLLYLYLQGTFVYSLYSCDTMDQRIIFYFLCEF